MKYTGVTAQRSEISPNEVFVVSGLLLNFNQGLVERHMEGLLEAVNPNQTGNALNLETIFYIHQLYNPTHDMMTPCPSLPWGVRLSLSSSHIIIIQFIQQTLARQKQSRPSLFCSIFQTNYTCTNNFLPT